MNLLQITFSILALIALVALIIAVLTADADSALLAFFQQKWAIAILLFLAGSKTSLININFHSENINESLNL